MKRDYLKLETITIYGKVRMTNTFCSFTNAYKAYLNEIEKRIKIDESVIITLYEVYDNGSQIDYKHCQL